MGMMLYSCLLTLTLVRQRALVALAHGHQRTLPRRPPRTPRTNPLALFAAIR